MAQNPTSENYDYIIVGAGSAGCVLANKLTECGRHKVLLIEAGNSDSRFWIKVPLGYGKTFNDPQVNWRYSAAKDPGLNNREAYWPRGRVIGGSSSINAMAYLRGLPNDFDDWERAGATGWNWDAVRQTYENLETHCERDACGQQFTRGSGPVWVSDVSDQMHPFSDHFLTAADEMDWPVAQNLNGAEAEGLMRLRSTVKNARRWSAADAFLRPAQKRPNLRVISGALVEQVLVTERRAHGVRYVVGGQKFTATTMGEVILSAGSVNSPQVLQLSGIGPARLLKTHGVEVKHDLPEVGQGLQDHLGISHYFHANVPTLNNKLGTWFAQMRSGARYLLTRKGPLSVPVNQVGGFVRSDSTCTKPDLQIYCNPMSYVTDAKGQTGVDPTAGFLLCAQPCRPTSRGQIAISSANPTDTPDIQPNSLATDHDCEMAVKACRVLQQLAQTPAIKAVTKTRLTPDVTTMSGDEMLQNFRERAGTIFHPTSTCRMGTTGQNSVLDARLRVHGVAGLRVVDASAFPNVTSGNTNAPVMMLAARAAQLILEDAKNQAQQGGAR
ncbi:GMC family oxidoreductase [Cochlodiniinecator piscidefendens]|uniref:GMC family oxidoreductase n=1 Tax=Cochlodiniinecator piscidefendens TaxID=2715756 RepID=UPI00140CD929|nr:GMC family oxidoreductase N-terminal domain-containing protein [Cochlodiniinecator piscidefendens]